MALLRHSMTDSLQVVHASLAQITDARIRVIDWIWTAPVLLIIALAVTLA
jgi:hypothetical protein